jgi:hypothetical protein
VHVYLLQLDAISVVNCSQQDADAGAAMSETTESQAEFFRGKPQ